MVRIMARGLRLGIGLGWLSARHNMQCCVHKDEDFNA